MSDEPYVPPLVALPGVAPSAEVVLHRTLNKVPRIKAAVVVIQWDDDSFSVDWSYMTKSGLHMAALLLNQTAVDESRTEMKP